MTPRFIHFRRCAIGGEMVLVVLCIAWAFLEKPAPIVNINWREGISTEARRQVERDLYLELVEDGDEQHYELGSPRTADIAAIVAHPDIDDTHRIDREHATLTTDSELGSVRVWWAGPFKGVAGHTQFRIVLVLVALVTLFCVRRS